MTHGVLDVAGMVPGLNVATTAIDMLVYTAEGNYVDAAITAAGFIPGEKIAANVTKIGIKAGAKVLGRAEEAAAEKLAKEAEEAAGESSGHVLRRKKVRCFTAGKKTKNKIGEYDRKLKDQEKGLNDMTVMEYLEGRTKFREIGRKGTGAEQQKARDAYPEKLGKKFKAGLNQQGVLGKAAADQAKAMADAEMKTLVALHNPDMIAGGKDVIGGVGDRGVNSSMDGQWKDRMSDVDNHAKSVPEAERATTKMNVKLERCP